MLHYKAGDVHENPQNLQIKDQAKLNFLCMFKNFSLEIFMAQFVIY